MFPTFQHQNRSDRSKVMSFWREKEYTNGSLLFILCDIDIIFCTLLLFCCCCYEWIYSCLDLHNFDCFIFVNVSSHFATLIFVSYFASWRRNWPILSAKCTMNIIQLLSKSLIKYVRKTKCGTNCESGSKLWKKQSYNIHGEHLQAWQIALLIVRNIRSVI